MISFSSWLKDTPGTVAIPTHFYKIITRCDESKPPFYEVPDCRGRLDVISFILPHVHRGRCKVSPDHVTFTAKNQLSLDGRLTLNCHVD